MPLIPTSTEDVAHYRIVPLISEYFQVQEICNGDDGEYWTNITPISIFSTFHEAEQVLMNKIREIDRVEQIRQDALEKEKKWKIENPPKYFRRVSSVGRTTVL